MLEIEVTDEMSASEVAAQIVAAVNANSSKVKATQGADDDTFVLTSVNSDTTPITFEYAAQ